MEHLEDTKDKEDDVQIKTEQPLTINYVDVCRLCLGSIELRPEIVEVTTVFSIFEDLLQYCHLAMTLANIKIEEHDCLPKKLCEECRMDLIQFYNFKRKCETTDRTLNDIFQTNIKPELEDSCVEMCTTMIDENFEDEMSNKIGGPIEIEQSDNYSEKDIFNLVEDHTRMKKKKKKSNKSKRREMIIESDEQQKILPVPKEKTRKVCEQCGLTFSSNCTLRRHRITHTGQKDFVCDICNNRFARKFHLDMHMRIHLKIRPHICETCASSFSTSSDLSRHRRIHVDVKNYACVVCDRRFKRSSDVIKHMRSHTGQKPYACKACDKKYSSHSGLSKHLRRHHPQLVVERVNEINEKKAKEQEIIEQRYENKMEMALPVPVP